MSILEMRLFLILLLFACGIALILVLFLISVIKINEKNKKLKKHTNNISDVKKVNSSKLASNNKLSSKSKTNNEHKTSSKSNISQLSKSNVSSKSNISKSSNKYIVYTRPSISKTSKHAAHTRHSISKTNNKPKETSKSSVSKITYNSLNVKQPDSNHGVYYLERYVKYSKWNEYPQYSEASKLLLDYKNNNSYAIRVLTIDLIKGILYISKNKIKENIDYVALVSIPPSNIMDNDTCPMKRSINIIKNAYDNKILECNKQILDYSDLLYRSISVKPARLCSPGERPTKQLHIQTISCRKKNISDNIAFILMDDITTKGTIMYACEEILINNGVKRENIFKLAIAGTMWVY